jgi:hypothetical protein
MVKKTMNTLRTLVFWLTSCRSINTSVLHVSRGWHWMGGMITDGVETQGMWSQVNVVQAHAKMQAGTIEVNHRLKRH